MSLLPLKCCVVERRAQKALVPVYEKRRAVVKAIGKFWPIALMNHSLVAFHAQHSTDQLAMSYLEDLWVERDPKEPRCFTIQFVWFSTSCGVEPVLMASLTVLQGEPIFFGDRVGEDFQVRATCRYCRGQARRKWHHGLDARFLLGP
jgi:hypothetical protein